MGKTLKAREFCNVSGASVDYDNIYKVISDCIV